MTTQPTTTRGAVGSRLAGLAATAALVALVAGLPLVLLTVGGSPLPGRVSSWAEVRAALTSPDDGTLALKAVTVVAWAVWLFLTGTVLLELACRVRRVRTPTLPVLRLPQATACTLVGAALTLFVAAPVLVAAPPAAHAQPATPPPAPTTEAPSPATRATPTPRGAAAKANTQEPSAHQIRPAKARVPSTVPYTVRRGDSLWSIAADHLGSGLRYPEIARLNTKLLHGRPGFLTPGTVLRIPAHHDNGPRVGTGQGEARQVVVHRGDTLSGIAADELGDADRYPDIFAASRSITQPGGVHLSDPDLIDVGWTLTIPGPPPHTTHHHTASKPDAEREGQRTRETAHPAKPSSVPAAPNATEPNSGPAPTPTTRPSAATPTRAASPTQPTGQPTAQDTHSPTDAPTGQDPQDSRDEVGAVAPSWLLTGLTGGGVILAGSLLMVLRRRRHEQFRNRRPGRTIPAPDPVLAPVEKTAVLVGEPATATVELMDAVLRRLAAAQAAAGQPMPRLSLVEISRTTLILHMDEPGDLPGPWQPSPDRLSFAVPADVDLDQVGPPVVDQPAPYPLLVTIGASSTGELWLLNCEQAGTVTVTGDPTYAADFARYVVAEVACNPWSAAVTVDCVGVAGEVAPMNPERVRAHPGGTDPALPVADLVADAVAMVDRTGDVQADAVTARAQQAGADAWPARLLLADLTDQAPAALDQLLRLIGDHPGRTGTAVILTGQHTPTPVGMMLHLDSHGRVTVPHARLALVAVGLTADEALGCAALLAQADTTTDGPIPDCPEADGWQGHANQAGALRVEHTLPRNTPPENLTEAPEPVLPADDTDYTQVAATTAEDLAVLSPRVPARVRAVVEAADPTLDADLEAWGDPDCALPRLILLGPVGARTRGAAIAKRKPYYTELLAYLATRPHGGTPDEVADAFSITGARVRNDIKVLRDWLGTNPRTGRKHLPDARDSHAAQARGIGVYQVDGLLTDADLFRRLRVRGETRGPDGITDLMAALTLVSGQPFDKLRPGGWTWLYEGDRLDHHLICAVVDVAHLVTTHHLHQHNLPAARAAAEIAALAAPYEEIPRLDLAAVNHAEGHHREAARIVRDDICNHTNDDGQPPTELSDRTQHIVETRDWLTRQEAAS